MGRWRVVALLTGVLLGLTAGTGLAATSVLFVVGNSALNPSDAAVQKHLEGMGWTVAVVDDDEAGAQNPDAHGIVVVSSTSSSANVVQHAKYLKTPKPVLSWENAVMDDYQIAVQTHGEYESDGVFTVKEAAHPIVKGVSGDVKAYSGPTALHSGVADAGKVVATIKNSDNLAVLAVDKGTKLADGSASPGKRVYFAAGDNTFESITGDGWKLFHQSLLWLVAP